MEKAIETFCPYCGAQATLTLDPWHDFSGTCPSCYHYITASGKGKQAPIAFERFVPNKGGEQDEETLRGTREKAICPYCQTETAVFKCKKDINGVCVHCKRFIYIPLQAQEPLPEHATFEPVELGGTK